MSNLSEWTVYTNGDSGFIHAVFNSVAMLSQDGTFVSMARIALLIAIIGMAFASALSGGRAISFQHVGVSIVAFLLFFQISARINIEDVQTGQFRAVDNVPVGLAASASVISTVGYSITRKMEQAFSTPAMTDNGPLDPLFTLTSLYDTMKTPIRWFIPGQEPKNSDLSASVNSYMKHCLANDITREAVTYNDLYTSPKGVNALESPDQFRSTDIHDGKGFESEPYEAKKGISVYVCADAFGKIKDQVARDFPQINKALEKKFRTDGRCSKDGDCDIETKLQDLMNFYNIGHTDIRDFQLTMMMAPYLKKLPEAVYHSTFKGAAAIARNQTVTQQSFQWASSGTSFLHWMKHFMVIFQGMIYALTPFMAFLFGLGVLGLRMVVKYFLVIVWTQTWLPLAAIVNMYVMIDLQEKMHVIFAGTHQVSFASLYEMLNQTQQSIGLAGNLYSMIPALGGFIVWGSSVAFSSLANSAAATSPADTRVLAPDITTTPPVINRNADFSVSRLASMTPTGASLRDLNVGEVAQSAVSSSYNEKVSAQSSMSAAARQVISHAVGTGDSFSKGRNFSDIVHSGYSMLDSKDKAAYEAIGKQFGFSGETIFAHTLSKNAGIGAGMLSATASAGTQNSHGSRMTLSEQQKIDEALRNTVKGTDSNLLSHALSAGGQAAAQILASRNDTSSEIKQFQQADSWSKLAERNYTSLSQLTRNAGSSQTLNEAQLSKIASDNPEAMNMLWGLMSQEQRIQAGIDGASLHVVNGRETALLMEAALHGTKEQKALAAKIIGNGLLNSDGLGIEYAGANDGISGNTYNNVKKNVADTQGYVNDRSAQINNDYNNQKDDVTGLTDNGKSAVYGYYQESNDRLEKEIEGDKNDMDRAKSKTAGASVRGVKNERGTPDVMANMMHLKPGDPNKMIPYYRQELANNNKTMRGTPEQIVLKNAAMEEAVITQTVLAATGQVAGNEAHIARMRSSFIAAGVPEDDTNGLINLMVNNASKQDEKDMQALNTAQTMLVGANLKPAPHRKDMEIMKPKYF